MKKYFFITLFFAFGCTSSKEVALLKVLQKQYQLSEKCAVLIIPNAGCTGCISDAEQFASKKMSSSKLFINMVGLRSKKLVMQKMGANFFLNPRVKIDTENEVKQLTGASIFPLIIYIEDNKIQKIVESSPKLKGNAWAELSLFLSEEKRAK